MEPLLTFTFLGSQWEVWASGCALRLLPPSSAVLTLVCPQMQSDSHRCALHLKAPCVPRHRFPLPPVPTASPILTPTSSHCLANLVSCVFSALYSVSPELSDCWRWEGMRSVKREAPAFGLSLTGNDENHMGYEKVQSNPVFTELPRNVNICHRETPKRGTSCCRTLGGRSHPSSPSPGRSWGVLTEGEGGYRGFADSCINTQRSPEARCPSLGSAVPLRAQAATGAGTPGTPPVPPGPAVRLVPVKTVQAPGIPAPPPLGRLPRFLSRCAQRIFLLLVTSRRSNPRTAVNAIDPSKRR